jgi:putative ABC transport system ATP-binding protein
MISLENVSRQYVTGDVTVNALNNISLNVDRGEFIAVMGKSGCGKSTLLNVLGTIDRAYTGKYLLDELQADKLSENDCCKLRQNKISIIYQSYNLLEDLSVYNNIILPAVLAREKPDAEKAGEIAESLNIREKLSIPASNLSGGEKQRVAIARSLYQNAELILADEPTGNLDSANSRNVMDKLLEIHKNEDKTIIMVTHDRDMAMEADKIIHMQDGCIVEVQE